MLVSAIVSTYNAQRFIKGRLENLVAQTLYQKGQLEIIVIDSNSQEDEGSIVQEFTSRFQHVRYLRTGQRETVYGAWNRGISMARGRYFINANTDDRFLDNALERLAGVLENQPEFAAAYGDWLYTELENDRVDSANPKELYKYSDFYPPLLFYYQFTSHALMIRCRVFKDVGLFNQRMEVFGDRDWVFRFCVAGLKAIHVQFPVGLYLKRADSLERANQGIGNAEFNGLLQDYQQPEYFALLHALQKIPEKKELAQLYALTGTLGINFAVDDGVNGSKLPQQSLIFFRRALELDPDNLMAGNNLAVAAALQGGKEFASDSFSRLLCNQFLAEKEMDVLRKNLEVVKTDHRKISAYRWCFPSSDNV